MKTTQLVFFCSIIIVYSWLACNQNPTESDGTPPTVIITQPANGVTLTAPVTIRVDATDNNGVKEVEFLVDGENIGKDNSAPFEQFWNISFWADDNIHTILAKAMDNSGNVGQSDIISVTISKDAMMLTELISPSHDSLFIDVNEITLEWSALPDAINYEVEVSPSTDFSQLEFSFSTADTAVTTTPLSEGQYFWRVRAQNSLGRYGDWSRVRSFKIQIVPGKIFGGSNTDEGNAVQQTSDGGFILAGTTASFGAGKDDIWLIKTDGNGEEQWNRTFGGSELDRGQSVQQTTDGGYIIAGYTDSFGAGKDDLWLIKTNSQGQEEWNRTFGGSERDLGYSVSQTTDGGFVACGITFSFGAGLGDVWLIKTDAQGNQQWNQVFGGDGVDGGNCVEKTTDGGYIIVGSTNTLAAPDNDLWLIKTDAQGNEEWNLIFGDGTEEFGRSVSQTFDGGYIVAGMTDQTAWLIKTDSNGGEQWNKTLGMRQPFSVKQTNDGGYILTGETPIDLGLIKTDQNGNPAWTQFFGGDAFDRGHSVQQTNDGGFIVTGITASYGNGSTEVWLLKIDSQGILIDF